MDKKYIIGIDEVGRGPIAGAVAIGAVLLSAEYDKSYFDGVKDSKKLTVKKREAWLEKIKAECDEGRAKYIVSFIGEKHIDDYGIVSALRKATDDALSRLFVLPDECLILLDGGLKAPEKFKFQKTIIRGDESEIPIALASIVAKVERDRKMILLAEQYPEYGFEKHKGYGTKEHYENIEKHGLCDIHRRSFLKFLLGSKAPK